MRQGLGDKVILLTDRYGAKVPIRYRDLRVPLGYDHAPSLLRALEEEEERIEQFRLKQEHFQQRLTRLNQDLHAAAAGYPQFLARARAACAAQLPGVGAEKRRLLLGRYYTLDRAHSRLLDDLVSHLLDGSEDDHSGNEVLLLRFALNHLLLAMCNESRKGGAPTAFHSIEAARGAAKNGQSGVTILATLLHDLLEDRLDQWSRDLILRSLDEVPRYAAHRGKNLKELPDEVRLEILRDSINQYNDRAAAIYYGIGLSLYSHVSLYKSPEVYYQTLNSLMEMLARLSRTRDVSYYNYLQQLLNPGAQPRKPDPIRRSRLLGALQAEFSAPEQYLDGFLRDVEGFYSTPEGDNYSRDEVIRNTFREVLAKILDRLNNTRDLDPREGFSIPKRLYGAGFKNIYFVQAVETRLSRSGISFEERRLIETKFINKPKIAALYQVQRDLEALEPQVGVRVMQKLREEIDRHRVSAEFSSIRSESPDRPYDGIILLFNEAILGNKRSLEALEHHPLRQARIALAFEAVLENFIAYPALIQEEMRSRKLGDPGMASFKRYRIEGMGPSGLESRGLSRLAREDLPVATFKRLVVDDRGPGEGEDAGGAAG